MSVTCGEVSVQRRCRDNRTGASGSRIQKGGSSPLGREAGLRIGQVNSGERELMTCQRSTARDRQGAYTCGRCRKPKEESENGGIRALNKITLDPLSAEICTMDGTRSRPISAKSETMLMEMNLAKFAAFFGECKNRLNFHVISLHKCWIIVLIFSRSRENINLP